RHRYMTAPKIGYLLPTRERIMSSLNETEPMLRLAEQAEALGYDSIWVGDSLLARPRHDPLTLMAAVAARTKRVSVGTAVLLPALRNPVVLAHQIATLDRIAEGRVILGYGIAGDVPNIRAEFAAAGVPFEKRVGRMLEGLRLCRALWSGKPVNWEGRWTVESGVLGPLPHNPGGPPIWLGTGHPAGLERAARHFDGWFPTGPDAEGWGEGWRRVQAAAAAAGRPAGAVTGAVYLTITLDQDTDAGNARIDAYLENYYAAPAAVIRRRQTAFAGPPEAVADWIGGYAARGAGHIVLRFVGDHERMLESVAGVRDRLG
ncbi:MAG: LLM class flavin-dependent oxidoreductase, partial [Alphaproteobacteria bacterium]|nr:LLM class flavin-dependent oxidoreductase [Alphaproteobacteria bacterium]